MYIVLKNLLLALRRYRTAAVLNVAGLAVAFTAFLVIMMQVSYEYGFDREIPRAESVFRVSQLFYGKYCAVLDQPHIERLTASSAHIAAGSLVGTDLELSGDFRVQRPNGSYDYFRSEVMQATPAFAQVVGLELIEGDASCLGRDDGVLIPQSLSQRLFAGESAVGEQILLSTPNASSGGYDRETPRIRLLIGGVYRDFPRNSFFRNAIYEGHPWQDLAGNCSYHYFVRLDDPQSLPEVLRAMERQTRAYMRESGDRTYLNRKETGGLIRLTNIRDLYFENDVAYEDLSASQPVRKGNRTRTDILVAIALLVILIASINFVNFASALAPVRMRMVNLQKILGAGVWQLRLSLIAESLSIAMMAYLVALCLTAALEGTPLAHYVVADISLAAHGTLVARCALLAALVGLLSGLYPACYMTSFRPVLSVRGSFGSSATGRRYRMALVGLQYVVSLSLIVATLFVNLQNRYMTRLETGYDKDRVVVVKLPSDAWQRYDALAAALRAESGIEDVARAYNSFGGNDSGYTTWSTQHKDGSEMMYQLLVVSDNFLRVLGIPVVEGRDFRPSDARREACSFIFNTTARKRYDLHAGDRIAAEGYVSSGWGQVVGFLPDEVQLFSQHKSEEPFAFVVFGERGWSKETGYCFIRIAEGAEMEAVVERIRRSIGAFTPYEIEVRYLSSLVGSVYDRELKAGVLVTLFSLLAIAVSLTGVFGLVLFEMQHRRKEIGIRKVHGATAASLLAMINRRFIAIVCVSFLVAAPLAWYGVAAWLRNFRSAVPMHAWVFVAAFCIVAAVTVLTVTLRTRRTIHENPVRSIKTE